MLISFPLVILQNFIRSPTVKKIYTITIGVSLLQFCFGVGFAISLLSHPQLDSLLYFGLGRLSAYALLQSSQTTDLRLCLLPVLSLALVHLLSPH